MTYCQTSIDNCLFTRKANKQRIEFVFKLNTYWSKLNISTQRLNMPSQYKKCFITVGTTRFDRLCKYILSPSVLTVLRKLGCEEITFQIGNSDVEPGNYEKQDVKIQMYRFKNSLKADMYNADLIISHAGAGSCLEALDANKPLLVVVNEELMNNHQLELADQLQVDGHLYYCTCDTLVSTLETVDFSWLSPLSKPNPIAFVKYIDTVFKVK